MSRVQTLLGALQKLYAATPALHGFAPWPDDLSAQQVLPNACDAALSLGVQKLRSNKATLPVVRALRAAAPDLEWRKTYTEDEVGARFLRTYGYTEIFGPTGHFHSYKSRGYLAIWGPDLTYDWHAHEAEELYFTLAGRAVFSARDASNCVLTPGGARDHKSWQSHFMMTLDQPYLAFVLWRGAGLDGLPKMMDRP